MADLETMNEAEGGQIVGQFGDAVAVRKGNVTTITSGNISVKISHDAPKKPYDEAEALEIPGDAVDANASDWTPEFAAFFLREVRAERPADAAPVSNAAQELEAALLTRLLAHIQALEVRRGLPVTGRFSEVTPALLADAYNGLTDRAERALLSALLPLVRERENNALGYVLALFGGEIEPDEAARQNEALQKLPAEHRELVAAAARFSPSLSTMLLRFVAPFIDGGATKGEPPPPPVARASGLTIYTGQETDTYFRGAANAKRGRNFTSDAQLNLCFYQTPGEPHRLQLDADEADDAEYNFMGLQTLIGEQDIDAAFVACYVLTLLTPDYPFTTGQRSGPVWIDLDDVAEKIGLAPDKYSAAEREAIRQRVRRYIKFGARARIIGKRSIPYYEKRAGHEKKAIPTDILHALWNVEAEQVPSNVADGLTPRRMQLTATAAVVPLLSSPDLAQFMHGGERIAAIPGGRPVGAWARSIGFTLIMGWRKQMQKAVDGTLLLTRRELLETYPPRIAAAAEVLNGDHPKRARDYWRDALAELAAQGIVERTGAAEWQSDEVEPKDKHENKGPRGAELPRKGWQAAWLDTPVLLHPGPFYRANLQMLLANKFNAPPRNLAASSTRKPGRPRKMAQVAAA